MGGGIASSFRGVACIDTNEGDFLGVECRVPEDGLVVDFSDTFLSGLIG